MAQIIIVGAGPAGVTLAWLLAQRGIPVTLIEASRSFRRLFRGEALMPSGLEALAQMGLLPLLEHLPHRPLDAWSFWVEGRSLFQVSEPIDPGRLPCTLVSQPALLHALIAKASLFPTFEFLSGHPVQALQWQEGRVSGVLLGNGHRPTADLVIGADGRSSLVRQQAGLALDEQEHPFDLLWFKLADGPTVPTANEFHSVITGRHAFGLFRSSEGELQVGWVLHREEAKVWKTVHWPERLAAASPPWLAAHFRAYAETIARPMLLSVIVGRAPRWFAPGLLLLGDAVHPMSPIRAQGINMALRDAIVAANHLVPLLKGKRDLDALDAVLPQIQAEREPEIIRVQHLQRTEMAQGELLRENGLIRQVASGLAPILGRVVKRSWVRRQRQLRQGVTAVRLRV